MRIPTILNKQIEPIFGATRKEDVPHSCADITKARQLLNYNPQYDFTRGLEIAVDWYQKNLLVLNWGHH